MRQYLMCPPTYFSVQYAINPWMTPDAAVDPVCATGQWQRLVDTFRSLGHRVDLLEPDPNLPDMVFAANGGIVIGQRAFPARFAYPQRAAEADYHRAWFDSQGLDLSPAGAHVNEGEGDFLAVGGFVLAGSGFRTTHPAHQEVQEFLGRPVVSLTLVDPRFYHLDVALAVLSDDVIAYHPQAFSTGSVRVLRHLFPDAIEVDADQAGVFALNAVSDGRHVLHDADAAGFAGQVAGAGFVPIPIEMTELRKAGGSVKCCTLELY